MPGQIGDLAAEKYSQDRHAECAIILANARILQSTSTDAASTTILSEKAMRDQPGEALANE